MTWITHSVEETQTLAARLAGCCVQACHDNGILLTLEGDLGAGKTTFSQGFIQSLCPGARVRSPTFSLMETYDGPGCQIHHLDLYRLNDPDELEYLGLRDLFTWHNICLIEWASRGEGWLPRADLALVLQVLGEHRQLKLLANTATGKLILEQMAD